MLNLQILNTRLKKRLLESLHTNPPPSSTAHHVSAQVDAEDGDSSQRKRNTSNDEQEEGWDLWDVAG